MIRGINDFDLGIDVLQSSHDNPAQRIVLFSLLVEGLCSADGGIESFFIFEPIDVFRTMRVDVLQASSKFIVQTINEADDTSPDTNNSAFFRSRRAFHEVIVIFRDLLHDESRVGSYYGHELVNFVLCRNPELGRHVGGRGGIVIEPGGDQSKKDPNPLISSGRELEQFFQYPNLFTAVSVLC